MPLGKCNFFILCKITTRLYFGFIYLKYFSGMEIAGIQHIGADDFKSIARSITAIENEVQGFSSFLESMKPGNAAVIGITGPPGAGKSTLTDALLTELVKTGKKIAVLCVDPSSPFNMGAVLGDRIRMNQWYNHPDVFIRSLATRGTLGGLNASIIEITEFLKSAGFEYILVETVGVGQSEIEIAGLADVTIVVLVPESGDDIQTMKAGIMEVADIFVVNKSDRAGADRFVNNLKKMLAPAFVKKKDNVPIIKTVASTGVGIPELSTEIFQLLTGEIKNEKKYELIAAKAFLLISKKRTSDINVAALKQEIKEQVLNKSFNLFRYIKKFEKP